VRKAIGWYSRRGNNLLLANLAQRKNLWCRRFSSCQISSGNNSALVIRAGVAGRGGYTVKVKRTAFPSPSGKRQGYFLDERSFQPSDTKLGGRESGKKLFPRESFVRKGQEVEEESWKSLKKIGGLERSQQKAWGGSVILRLSRGGLAGGAGFAEGRRGLGTCKRGSKGAGLESTFFPEENRVEGREGGRAALRTGAEWRSERQAGVFFSKKIHSLSKTKREEERCIRPQHQLKTGANALGAHERAPYHIPEAPKHQEGGKRAKRSNNKPAAKSSSKN